MQLGLGLYTVAQDIRPIHSKIFTRVARRYLYFKLRHCRWRHKELTGAIIQTTL